MIDCPFCAIVAGSAPATFVLRHPDVVAFLPLNPVTPGHVLVVPTEHVTDALEDPILTGDVMEAAAQLARRPCNLIVSSGREATQTVDHLHVHIVPRHVDDGLALPWTDRVTR